MKMVRKKYLADDGTLKYAPNLDAIALLAQWCSDYFEMCYATCSESVKSNLSFPLSLLPGVGAAPGCPDINTAGTLFCQTIDVT